MDNQQVLIYKALIEKYQEELKIYSNRIRLISLGRGGIFLAMAICLYLIGTSEIGYFLLTFILFTIPFLFLLKLHVNIRRKAELLKELIKINENEISGIHGDYSVFDPGNRFIDPSHPYSFDLDIFGDGSIYQLVNRTCTAGGARKLAEKLSLPLSNKEDIIIQQKAVEELKDILQWRQIYQASGNLILKISEDSGDSNHSEEKNKSNFEKENIFHNEMMNWLNSPFHFSESPAFKYLLMFFPLISLILFILMLTGLFPVMGFIGFGLFQLGIVITQLKKVNRIHQQLGRKTLILKKYGELLFQIENQNFNSSYLCNLKATAGLIDQTAGRSLKKLQGLTSALDNRLNILVSIVANAYLLWDLQVVYKVELWRRQNSAHLPLWLETIYQFDAISGFSAFSYNNPDYCIPEIKSDGYFLQMKGAGHPLINKSLMVTNDLEMGKNQKLLVITGANMAGKSTFLRTIGVNLILAMAGSVVCAHEFITCPIGLHTSIRTTDSVQKNESYFYAELIRLKAIIDRLAMGEKLFIIIDEMLRGTNSKDKHVGSQALIEQLIRLGGTGLLATHDIALGELADKYPSDITNYRFEVEIKNDELFFDYKLKTGISQNLNASFLMKKMGITL